MSRFAANLTQIANQGMWNYSDNVLSSLGLIKL